MVPVVGDVAFLSSEDDGGVLCCDVRMKYVDRGRVEGVMGCRGKS